MCEDGDGGHAEAAVGPAGHEENLLGNPHQHQGRQAGGQQGEGTWGQTGYITAYPVLDIYLDLHQDLVCWEERYHLANKSTNLELAVTCSTLC